MRFRITKLPRSEALFSVQKEKERRVEAIFCSILKDYDMTFYEEFPMFNQEMFRMLKMVADPIMEFSKQRKKSLTCHSRKIYPSTKDMKTVILKVFNIEMLPDYNISHNKTHNIIESLTTLCYCSIVNDKEIEEHQSVLIRCIIRNLICAYVKIYKKMPNKYGSLTAISAEYDVYHSLPALVSEDPNFDLVSHI